MSLRRRGGLALLAACFALSAAGSARAEPPAPLHIAYHAPARLRRRRGISLLRATWRCVAEWLRMSR